MKESLKAKLERLKSEKLPDSTDNALSSLLSIPTINTETIVKGVNPDNQEGYDEESLFGTSETKVQQQEFSPEILEVKNLEPQLPIPLTKPEIIASIIKQLHNLPRNDQESVNSIINTESTKILDNKVRRNEIKKTFRKITNSKNTLRGVGESEKALVNP